MKRKIAATLVICGLLTTGLLSGCGQTAQDPGEPPRDVVAGSNTQESSPVPDSEESIGDPAPEISGEAEAGSDAQDGVSRMTMQFGYGGPTYTIELEDNDTAATLSDYAARSAYNLPIYTYENYENEEVLQFYDIPGRYAVPAETEHYTEEKAGELYYSYPNRVILFYQDAEIEGDYTKIGTLTSTEGLVEAVTNNEPLEDWDCLVIPVRVID